MNRQTQKNKIMNTLFKDNKDTVHKLIGNGYSIVFIKKHLVHVYKQGVFYKEYDIYDQFDKRLFAVDMVVNHGVTQIKLAQSLGVSRTSIRTWLDTYRDGGQKALINSTKSGVGRKPNSGPSSKKIVRPEGDKFKLTEQRNQEKRQEKQEQELKQAKSQLCINFDKDIDFENNDTEHFNEKFEQNNRYAGSFIFWTIFQKDNSIMSMVYTFFKGKSYVFYTFLMMHILKIGSIEQLKTQFKEEFGPLIGLSVLPSLVTLRQNLHELVSKKLMNKLLDVFFRYQISRGIVNLWCLFIDGHFIPYTGKEKVHKNYHTQTQTMKPGQNEIFIHDIDGKVVYFDLQEGKGDMLSVIIDKSKEYKQYLGNISPLFVADKEIWGVEKFLLLSGSCRFITWEKNTDKKIVDDIDEKNFSVPFTINGIVYQVYETEKTYTDVNNKSIKLRRLIIWNHKTGKRSVAVSNDTQIQDTISLCIAMLNRWGCSENGFKHMGERTNMHYNPIIDIQQQSDSQQAGNPIYYKLEKKLKSLKTELAKHERELGKKPLTKNKDGSLRKNASRDELIKQVEKTKNDINLAKKELESCPEKINLVENDNLEKYKVIETEGKKVWDFTQIVFWNSRKRLLSILKKYLPDKRDLIPVFEAITKCTGNIKSTNTYISVTLEPLERPAYLQAQIQFCRKLTAMNAKMDNGKILLFDVDLKNDQF